MITVVTLVEVRPHVYQDETRVSTFVYDSSKTYAEVVSYFADHLAHQYYSRYLTNNDPLYWRESVEGVLEDVRAKSSQGVGRALERLCVAYEAFARARGHDMRLTVDMSCFLADRIHDTIRRIDE